MSTPKPLKVAFRPRARILKLLGEELIGSPRLAVFELVKNAYDACASNVTVRFMDLDKETPWIEVIDDGEGMTRETIENVWMVPGHDRRMKERDEKRDKKEEERPGCHRLPLGEKGLGRFAVHKLGDGIELVTRAAGEREHAVDIDWGVLIGQEFLDEAMVEIKSRAPEVFKDDKKKQSTGTRIRVWKLKPSKFWKRGEIRRLHRQITSICSPFMSPQGFSATLEVPGQPQWIQDIPGAQELIDLAFWHYKFTFDAKNGFCWSYKFAPHGLKLQSRKQVAEDDELIVRRHIESSEATSRKSKDVRADASYLDGIGPLSGEFHVFDRDKDVLAQIPEPQLLKDYLDQHGGVQVFRDGIRVYNYGEPGDDWLGLDLRRVQTPTRRLSRNLIIGAIHLSLAESSGLTEKTNREGFVENEVFGRFCQIVLGVLANLEHTRFDDKNLIRRLLAKEESEERHGISQSLEAIRVELRKTKVYDRCKGHLRAIERRYTEMKENLLQPAVASINLSLIFHEVERGVHELLRSILNREEPEFLERRARDMQQLLEEFSSLLRRHKKKVHRISELTDRLRAINAIRFKAHYINLKCDISMDSDKGFAAEFPFGLALGAVNNLIDNSIYWMNLRWSETPESWETSPRRLYIGVTRDLPGGPALVIADTGPGLRDEPANLVRAFYTRKPEGMGLGLYYTNMVMEICGGKLVFPMGGDIDLPPNFDGAVIAMQFPEEK